MDQMILESKFMQTIISKILKKIVKKKIGYDIDIQITELQVFNFDDKARIILGATTDIQHDELNNILKGVISKI